LLRLLMKLNTTLLAHVDPNVVAAEV
jgi:hypothetical protein